MYTFIPLNASFFCQQDQPTGVAKAADVPLATGRLATMADINGGLKGRQAEVSRCSPRL